MGCIVFGSEGGRSNTKMASVTTCYASDAATHMTFYVGGGVLTAQLEGERVYFRWKDLSWEISTGGTQPQGIMGVVAEMEAQGMLVTVAFLEKRKRAGVRQFSVDMAAKVGVRYMHVGVSLWTGKFSVNCSRYGIRVASGAYGGEVALVVQYTEVVGQGTALAKMLISEPVVCAVEGEGVYAARMGQELNVQSIVRVDSRTQEIDIVRQYRMGGGCCADTRVHRRAAGGGGCFIAAVERTEKVGHRAVFEYVEGGRCASSQSSRFTGGRHRGRGQGKGGRTRRWGSATGGGSTAARSTSQGMGEGGGPRKFELRQYMGGSARATVERKAGTEVARGGVAAHVQGQARGGNRARCHAHRQELGRGGRADDRGTQEGGARGRKGRPRGEGVHVFQARRGRGGVCVLRPGEGKVKGC